MDYKQSLSFTGVSQAAIVRSLSGTGTLDVKNGALNGMDLNALSDRLEDPNSLSDFLGLFDQLSAGGTTAFDNFSAPITIKDGVVQSDKIAMISKDVTLTLDGRANLPEWSVRAKGLVNFTARSNIPPLGMTVYGTLDNPQKRFDKDNITRFIRTKATQAIGRKIGEQLLGKGMEKSTPKTTQEPLQAPNPANDNYQEGNKTMPTSKDALKRASEDLIRGLLGQ
jgi:uncharacterized protein involved in outer membrane biogenesis